MIAVFALVALPVTAQIRRDDTVVLREGRDIALPDPRGASEAVDLERERGFISAVKGRQAGRDTGDVKCMTREQSPWGGEQLMCDRWRMMP
jgi:hypothetical protein